MIRNDPSLHPPSNAAMYVEAEMFGHCLYNNVQDLNKLKLCLVSFCIPILIQFGFQKWYQLTSIITSTPTNQLLVCFMQWVAFIRPSSLLVHSQNFSLTNSLSASDSIQSINDKSAWDSNPGWQMVGKDKSNELWRQPGTFFSLCRTYKMFLFLKWAFWLLFLYCCLIYKLITVNKWFIKSFQ